MPVATKEPKKCRTCTREAKADSDYCRPCNAAHKGKKSRNKVPPPKGSVVESSTIQSHTRVKKRWKALYKGRRTLSEDFLMKPGDAWMPTFRRNVAAEASTEFSSEPPSTDT